MNGTVEIFDYDFFESSFSFKDDYEVNFLALRVYQKIPNEIRAYNGTVLEFSYHKEDLFLLKLIRKYIDVNYYDLLDKVRKINENIHNDIKCANIDPIKEYFDNKLSVGEVIKSKKAVCRHIAALEYAIFTLLNISCDIVATDKIKKPNLNELHSFIHINISGKHYMVDSVNNFFFLLEDVVFELKKLGKTLDYHEHVKPLRFEFLH